MADMAAADRAEVWADYMRRNRDDFGSMDKADLRAAVDALDTWIDGRETAVNTAIPQPARAALSRAQKYELLMFVLQRRVQVGA